ncbi:MAG: EAL domain-containing protein [Aeromonadaceae bacterium]
MRKLMTELRRQALLMMVGVLLLNGIAIYLLQKQQIQQHNQSVAAVLATELATPDLTPGRLVALRDALQLSAIAVTSQASEAPQLQSRSDASDWLKYLYPELQGEILLSQPGQKALYTLSQEGLLTSALLQGGVLTVTLLLALFGILAIQRRHYEQVTASLIHEIVETEGSDHCVSSEISTALQNMRDLQQTQLANVTQQVAQLELIINQDALTGVLNRSTFNQDLTQATQMSLSLLAIVRATELTAINQRHGHVAGDKYLQTIANLITRASKKLPNAKVYRLAGSDFAILQSQSNNNQAQLLGHELKMLFDHYLNNEEEFESVAYVGLTLCRPGQQVEQVMGRGDLALAKAQTSIVNGWFFQEKDVEDYLQGEAHWKRVITDVIARQAILLMQQPIQSMNISIKSYNEIFARFVGENEQVMPTETLLAMAQRHDLLGQLEQLIIEQIMQQYPTQSFNNQRWGINLSANALMNHTFLIWLERQLLKNPQLASNLVFEMDEELLDCNLAASTRLFEMLRRAGSRACISKFGKGLASFRLYRELKPDYIKLDPSLINVLERDHTSQQFIRMIVEVSHRLGCVVVAEGVETIAQKQLLETLFIDAIQGYLIARPSPLA